jgi:hypothetical protein
MYTSGLSTPMVGRRGVRRLRQLVKQHNQCSILKYLLWSIDHEKYDRNVPNEALDIYFAINELALIFPCRAHEVIYSLLRMYLKYAPFVVDDIIYFMERGIPSGSFITNHFGTWWHATLWHVAYIMIDKSEAESLSAKIITIFQVKFTLEEMYLRAPLLNILLCGDDALIATTSIIIGIFIGVCSSVLHKVTYRDPVINQKVYFLGKYWLQNCNPWQSFEYMTAHIIYRTKFYKKEELPFDLNMLSLNRVLSICLEFSNGFSYLEEMLHDWKPYADYKDNPFTTYLMKDWQDDEYIPMTFSEQLNRSSLG